MIVNPEMLIIARDVRGLTCEQAAEQMSIEWGTLSRYESGKLPVPEDDLNIISKALRFPASSIVPNREDDQQSPIIVSME